MKSLTTTTLHHSTFLYTRIIHHGTFHARVFYTPKKYFTGDKLLIFRGFVLIPLIWSLLGYIFLGVNDSGSMIPGYLFPLIPLKPPSFLLVFLSLVVFLKIKERRFVQSGKTLEEYDKEFASPESVHSFPLSLAIGSGVDIILFTVFDGEENRVMQSVGFGQGSEMFLVIPIILFYDFNKPIKNSSVSTLIPIIGYSLITLHWCGWRRFIG